MVIGTGQVGRSVISELLSRGETVRAVNRSGRSAVPPGVELAEWDITVPEEARRAVQGASVVYGCFNAPYTRWPEVFPPLMDGFIIGVEAAGARAVFADNLYMYGPPGGELHEGLPNAPAGPKGKVRLECAERFLAAHEAGRIRGAVGRASDLFGPGVVQSAAGERLFGALLQARPVDLLGDPSNPHTFTFVRDFARALVTLGEHEEAMGKVWHVPSAETLTIRGFVARAAEEAGVEARIRVLPRWIHAGLALFDPLMRELKETRYQFEEPWVVNHSRFEAAFGARITPHPEALQKTLEWFRRQPFNS